MYPRVECKFFEKIFKKLEKTYKPEDFFSHHFLKKKACCLARFLSPDNQVVGEQVGRLLHLSVVTSAERHALLSDALQAPPTFFWGNGWCLNALV